MESQLVVAEGREGVGQEGSGRGKEETARVPLGGDVTAVLQNVTAAGGAERRPPGLAPGAGRSGGSSLSGGRCRASRLLASLPETWCLPLLVQAGLPVGSRLPKTCIAPPLGLHPLGEQGPKTC